MNRVYGILAPILRVVDNRKGDEIETHISHADGLRFCDFRDRGRNPASYSRSSGARNGGERARDTAD